MSVKQKIINKEITYKEACTERYNDLTKKHVDFIVENYPWAAAKHLNHNLSEENIAWITHNHPEHLKEVFK